MPLMLFFPDLQVQSCGFLGNISPRWSLLPTSVTPPVCSDADSSLQFTSLWLPGAVEQQLCFGRSRALRSPMMVSRAFPCIASIPVDQKKLAYSRKTWLQPERGCGGKASCAHLGHCAAQPVCCEEHRHTLFPGRNLITQTFNKWTAENCCVLAERVKYEDTHRAFDPLLSLPCRLCVLPTHCPVRPRFLFLLFQKLCFCKWIIPETCPSLSSPMAFSLTSLVSLNDVSHCDCCHGPAES